MTWSKGHWLVWSLLRHVAQRVWPQPRLMGGLLLPSNWRQQTGHDKKSFQAGDWMGIFVMLVTNYNVHLTPYVHHLIWPEKNANTLIVDTNSISGYMILYNWEYLILKPYLYHYVNEINHIISVHSTAIYKHNSRHHNLINKEFGPARITIIKLLMLLTLR